MLQLMQSFKVTVNQQQFATALETLYPLSDGYHDTTDQLSTGLSFCGKNRFLWVGSQPVGLASVPYYLAACTV